jgi:hypothetical protein
MVEVFCPVATYTIPEISKGKKSNTGQRGNPNFVKKMGKKIANFFLQVIRKKIKEKKRKFETVLSDDDDDDDLT